MIHLLITLGYSWCPFFHQSITRQFSYEFYPYITDAQREAFIVGSIYADGVDKSITHNIQYLHRILKQLNPESELYWFFLGNYAHISTDIFAHAGKTKSFIVPRGIKHHISEVIIDSLIVEKYNPPYITISSSLQKSLEDMGIGFIRSFRFLYPLIRFATKFPLYKLLPKIQSNGCPASDLDTSICNFMNHYGAMLSCMWGAFQNIRIESYNELRLKELSISLLYGIDCCESSPINVSIAYNYDDSILNPILSQNSI